MKRAPNCRGEFHEGETGVMINKQVEPTVNQ
jgi:hypothetical protein